MREKPWGKTFALLLALAGTLALTACPKSQTLRAVAAGLVEGSRQFRAEVAGLLEAGELSRDEAELLTAAAGELQGIGGGVVTRAADWQSLSRAERIALAADAVEAIGASVERLSAQSIGIKSPKAKARLGERLRQARLAVSALRVIEASVRPEPPRQ